MNVDKRALRTAAQPLLRAFTDLFLRDAAPKPRGDSTHAVPRPVVRSLFLAAVPLVVASTALATVEYYDSPFRADRLVSTPGSSRSVAAGLENPASWPIQGSGGLYLGYDRPAQGGGSYFTGVLSMQHLGLGVERIDDDLYATWLSGFDRGRPNRFGDRWAYTIGTGFGTEAAALGCSYRWMRSAGGTPRDERVTVGTVERLRFLSLGLARTWQLEDGPHTFEGDLGLRPIGPRVTVFGDLRGNDDTSPRHFVYGLGGAVDLFPGVNLGLRWEKPGDRSHGATSIRISLSPSQDTEASYRYHTVHGDDRRAASTYAVEFHRTPTVRQAFHVEGRYDEIRLGGPLTYRTYRFFDDRTRLMPLLARIDALAARRDVDGVVIRLSGFQARPALLWELRAQLEGLRASGKKVVLYLDRVSLFDYMLATAADQVWIDPLGSLDLRGLNLGRTYYHDMLEKMGVGFDEWRFFRYKTFAESYSRDSMSDADREQLGALVDDLYDETVRLICTSRKLSEDDWNHLVDHQGLILPEEAVSLGLVDSVGTYQDARKAAPDAPRRDSQVGATAVAGLGTVMGDPIWSSVEWGERPRIALLYAIGPCDMDSGIRGRQLAQAVRQAREDRRVKAVVLRVDSPGGDPLPSDLVARELRETSKSKPVVISQGQVAASGGYWLSMYADSIVASPLTITGSIGVIAGHVWDNGLGEKIGMSYESVKRGSGADIEAGPSLPLLGVSIPKRPVTAEERSRAESIIRQLYDGFVSEVAEGRGMSEDAVQEIAQGRVWSGSAGVGNGLVDEVGGLWEALALARAAAGLGTKGPVEIVEGPELGWFDLYRVFPSPISTDAGLSLRGRIAGLLGRTRAVDASGAGDGGGPGFGYDGPEGEISPLLGHSANGSAGPFADLPISERSYLEQVIRHHDQPLVRMPPLSLEGVDLVEPAEADR